MMKRAESSILGIVEIVGGVAIATAVREIANSSCRSHLRSVMAHERYCVVGSYHSVMGWYLLLVFIAETELCAGRVLF